MQIFSPISLYLAVIMSILITREQIIDSLPIGASEEEARTYLLEVAEDVRFVTRETERARGLYTWRESEIGYLQAGIDNARSKWWKPSFGSYLTIRVGISAERNVTQVSIIGSRTGFP
tara:strand:- start:243 stop:596 length:354 start_codon:yes stop_codon:yes gene_type:complete